MLGAGNWREITRLAERAASFPGSEAGRHLGDLIMTVAATETASLLREITGNAAGTGVNSLADDAKLGAWNAFPPDTFRAEGRFTQLSKAAIREWWQPRWHDAAAWQAFRGPWQGLLVRLFIGGRVIVALERSADPSAADAMMTAVCGLAQGKPELSPLLQESLPLLFVLAHQPIPFAYDCLIGPGADIASLTIFFTRPRTCFTTL